MVESLNNHTKHTVDGQGKLKSVSNRRQDEIKPGNIVSNIFFLIWLITTFVPSYNIKRNGASLIYFADHIINAKTYFLKIQILPIRR